MWEERGGAQSGRGGFAGVDVDELQRCGAHDQLLQTLASVRLQAPCTFARTVSASSTTTSPTNPNQNSQNHQNRPAPAAYDAEFPRSVLRVGAPLCVSWAANAHDRDVHRNEGSTRGVRFAISEKAEPTMADFDKVCEEKAQKVRGERWKIVVQSRSLL